MTTDLLKVSESTDARRARAVPMRLLAAGVPLTLLIDLLSAHGPDSTAINAIERPAPGSMVVRNCG
jgi:hypothetical protein